jgi:predicted metal-dependent hydrolase
MIELTLENLEIQIVQKKIKKLYLSVYPPHGQVRISAPSSMSLETIRQFVLSKREWIKKQQEKILKQHPNTLKQFIDNELHDFCGKSYYLKLIETQCLPQVILTDSEIILYIRPHSCKTQKAVLLDAWYRQQLQIKVFNIIPIWEKKMQVNVSKLTIQKMKTKWGSCTPALSSIRLNLELIKKPLECLDYVIVHELAHLIEPSHNHRFKAVMDTFLPDWRLQQKRLNY